MGFKLKLSNKDRKIIRMAISDLKYIQKFPYDLINPELLSSIASDLRNLHTRQKRLNKIK